MVCVNNLKTTSKLEQMDIDLNIIMDGRDYILCFVDGLILTNF
jgi:hypothetical protein